MVAFAISMRRAKDASLSVPSASSRLRAPSTQASMSLNKGINHLLTLQNGASSRRRFSSSISQAISPASTPAASPRPVSPIPLPDQDVPGPSMPIIEDPAALEAARLQKDHVTAEEELDAYLCALCESRSISTRTLVQFWDVSIFQLSSASDHQLTIQKLNEKKYPLLFQMALDVLPVQASAVPCEHIFSSSKQSCEDH